MYVIDLRHFLDDKGAIAVPLGPGRKLAGFVAAVVAHASDLDRPEDAPAPHCFKCRRRERPMVEALVAEDQSIVWQCPVCSTHGTISGWQDSFWDLSQGRPSE